MSYSPPSSAKPFTLSIPDTDLSEFRQLLQLSKLGRKTFENQQDKQSYGVTYEWLSEAKDHWLNTYSWREQEKHINSFPNYKMKIGDVDVHFVALFSEKKDAVPIIFMHGWPGSFIEFLPMCELIRKKYDAKDLSSHIIVPSVPGYTLSSGLPVDKDWTLQDSARVLDQLMQNLGFSKYIAQGGDIGCFLAITMSLTYDSCTAIHLNMMAGPRKPVDESNLSALEKSAVQYAKKWVETGMAYART
ncbi:epoxide hydrolase 1 [Lentithecium fluviatile CBS 122367]|uniref:Epoxide hydrolase 1 n=1 Tax=Lentithecium fluviatile CBS 122367 TaxID=1168545 RepID=A0A6G1IRW5_9PLEO|nr:epoxide hydrolase 1 [Lentithecium fluviatile CBS 122367]